MSLKVADKVLVAFILLVEITLGTVSLVLKIVHEFFDFVAQLLDSQLMLLRSVFGGE